MYTIVVSGTRQEHSTFRKYCQKLLNLRCPCHIYCEWDCKVAGVWTVVQMIIISIRSESQLGSAYMQYWSGLYNNIDTHLSTTLLVMPHQLHQRRCSAWHGRHHCSSVTQYFLRRIVVDNVPISTVVWGVCIQYTDLSTVKPFLGNGPEPLTLIRPFATSTPEK